MSIGAGKSRYQKRKQISKKWKKLKNLKKNYINLTNFNKTQQLKINSLDSDKILM
jgi:cell fate (sporulation/competence/biofilm development) regulator YmcA (YheA/YmcA/DUF963 family)